MNAEADPPVGRGAGEPRVLVARLRTPVARVLPPMFTTAMHGVLGHALESTACLEVDGCRGTCRRPGSCAYAELFAPSSRVDRTDAAGSREERTPPPLVLAPLSAVGNARPVRVAAGEEFGLRIVLVGERAAAQRSLLTAALRTASQLGLGPPNERAPFEIASLDETAREPFRTIDNRLKLRLITPLRIVVDGHVRSRFDANALWRAVLRRLRLLHEHHGLALPSSPPPETAPFEIVRATTQLVPIRRWSNRQKSHMTWPGIVGSLELRGTSAGWIDAQAWLDIASVVQIGKGTSFGFGRFELSHLTSDTHEPSERASSSTS